MQYASYSVEEFVSRLASKDATPGGGGTAALVGALGVALGNMVVSLTEGKKKYADVQEEMAALKERLTALQKELLVLIDQDAEAFMPLSLAYKMPGGTEEEKRDKQAAMQAAVKEAAAVPMAIAKTCAKALPLIKECAQKGSRLAVSDAGCGAALCKAAMQAAALNVYINTATMADKAQAKALNDELDNLLQAGISLADEIYDDVLGALRREA